MPMNKFSRRSSQNTKTDSEKQAIALEKRSNKNISSSRNPCKNLKFLYVKLPTSVVGLHFLKNAKKSQKDQCIMQIF